MVVEKSIGELANLTLDHQVDSGNGEQLVDITEHLRRLTAALKPETVVKEATFNLFEGTYALEVCNVKLDTSLIELNADELDFDCNFPYGDPTTGQRLEYVTAVCDRLCRSLMNWLHDYQTLPTTVLSCRYVEYLMELYTANPVSSLQLCQGLFTHDPLYDRVLGNFVIGVCSFIKFTSKVLKDGGVYEEEDLNCNVMNLDMLSGVSTEEVIDALRSSLRLLIESYPESQHLQRLTDLLIHMLHLPKYHYPSCQDTVLSDLTPLYETLDIVESLVENGKGNTAQYSYPPGCFSKGIQKRRDNNFPPKDIYEPKGDEYTSLDEFMKDIIAALSVKECNTAFEIRQFVWFFNRLRQRTVMARALLQSYLIREDSILGKFSFDAFKNMHLYEFSLAGTTLYDVISNKDQTKSHESIAEALNELSYCLLRWYQNMPQNACRHRQGFNRLLLDWDSVQAQFEQYESHWQSMGIEDRITNMGDIPLMPVSTWIYTTKLLMMIEFSLEGFHLEVYKPWESFTQYWFCYYLSSHLESNLKRLHEFLMQKMSYISNYNKKIKKLKAGEKKEKAKSHYKHLTDVVLPQLKINEKTVNYYFMMCTIVKSLSLAQVFQFALLKSFNIIDARTSASTRFSSDKFIHDLRFKTFSSIGIPEVPTFEQFQKSLKDFLIESPSIHSKIPKLLSFMNTELENAKIALNSVIKTIETGEAGDSPVATGTKHVRESALLWFKSMLNSAVALSVNGSVLKTKLSENLKLHDLHDVYDVELKFTPNGSYYFPLLTLLPKHRKSSSQHAPP
ncbi:unnamed protein product [Kluyveromyces dobzhanskii CBS 2104]|uniref:WGS project CCBQ000000000 data, contig 00017 n=1 Tax=Kluyveromyces dobzhanskii CBS 2104 TaxID=1427455 RepID=A0A0A8L881_9SACH|nr:unnamed protein product [Kluyveromyces dobzhanskii CBS 2104]